jgi:hypothetical protein
VTEGAIEQGRGSGGKSRRAASWLAWCGWLLSLVGLALSLLLTLFLPVSGGITDVVANSVFAVVFAAIVLSFSTVGALIATRQPRNPIGWIMIVAGFGLATTILTGNYVEFSLAQPPGRLPATEWVVWVTAWVWVLGFGPALTFLFLMFPNGRLPSRRWRPVGWLAVANCCSRRLILSSRLTLPTSCPWYGITVRPPWPRGLRVPQPRTPCRAVVAGLVSPISGIHEEYDFGNRCGLSRMRQSKTGGNS